MKTILLTGGGTAGHVTPNLALLPQLRAAGWHIEYIGSETGIEKQLVEKANLPYHAIASGKLRRYFDLQNFKDPFKVLRGALQAYFLIKKIKPRIVFSKGGFVSVPVVFAAWCQRIPVIIHESDITPGLANRLAAPFAAKVCLTFPEGLNHFSEGKGVYTGTPIRSEILQGNAEKGLQLCSFTHTKPVLLVMGGSLGSEKINRLIRSQIGQLLKHFQIVHLCGKGNVDASYAELKGYQQFEYLHDELPHVLAMSDMVVSRAGANSICEFLALKKPMLLIPLTLQQSRGDQIVNAKSFAKQGYSQVMFEENLIDEKLTEVILETYQNREQYIENMKSSPLQNSVQTIVHLVEETAKR